MTKENALKLLRSSDHGFLGEETVKEIATAFGVKIPTYLAKANPDDFKGLTLWDEKGNPVSEARGQDAAVAMEVCDRLKISYMSFFGRGSQLAHCCDQIEFYLTNK
jgi:hypothetical protein